MYLIQGSVSLLSNIFIPSQNLALIQLFQFNWNYITYMSTEMKSHGDSGLVPTCWGKNDYININQQNFRINTIKVYCTEWCQNFSTSSY